MNLSVQKNYKIISGILLALIMSCSTGPTVKEFSSQAIPSDEITKLSIEMSVAYENQADILSPNNFKEAQKYLGYAQKSIKEQGSAKDTLHFVAVGRAYFNQAHEKAKIAYDRYSEAIVARQHAIKSGASVFFSTEFDKNDERLKSITVFIEKNDMTDFSTERDEIRSKFLDLELRSIKLTWLEQSKNIIAQAINEGAKDYAPKSLMIAERNIEDANDYITTNRHDSGEISARSYNAKLSADYLLQITRDSKKNKRLTSEDQAMERDNQNIQLSIKQNQLDNIEATLIAEEEINQNLSKENLDLKSAQSLNDLYDQAKATFSSSEADVFKNRDSVKIRLKGLTFPTSKALITEKDLPILAKVAKVVNSHDSSSVVVEGHTDSLGGHDYNKRLSTERALAVKKHILNQLKTGGDSLNISAVGLDSQKPLASNKTSSGRAKNRRIDISIHY